MALRDLDFRTSSRKNLREMRAHALQHFIRICLELTLLKHLAYAHCRERERERVPFNAKRGHFHKIIEDFGGEGRQSVSYPDIVLSPFVGTESNANKTNCF